MSCRLKVKDQIIRECCCKLQEDSINNIFLLEYTFEANLFEKQFSLEIFNILTPNLASVTFKDIKFIYNGITILKLDGSGLPGQEITKSLGANPTELPIGSRSFDFYPRNEGSVGVFEYNFSISIYIYFFFLIY